MKPEKHLPPTVYDGDTGFRGKKTHCFRKKKALRLHDIIENRSALPAAEAVEKILLLGDVEGWRLFAVKGAQADKASADPLKRDALAYYIRKADALSDGFDYLGSDYHGR